MKIAFVVRHYNKSGGISNYVAELAKRLAKNHEVHIFASSWEFEGGFKLIFHKVPMISFSFLKKIKKYSWNNVFEVWSFLLFSFLIVKYKDFDVIHSQGDYIGNFDVYTVHSCHKAWLKLASAVKISFLEKLKKSYFNPLHFNILLTEKVSLFKARKVIVISQGIKKEIIQYYRVPEKNVMIIQHGVDINKFNPLNKTKYRDEIRKKYGLSENDFVIIFPAHEFKRKGLYQIIEAIHILKNENIYVLVVGRDNKAPFMNEIRKYDLINKFIFVGESDEIYKHYAAVDLLVFPTAYEPFGLVIIEAMSAGLPFIVSKVAGAAELIVDNESGILLENHQNIGELSDKIRSLVDNPERRAKLATAARKIAESYSWDHIVQKTNEVYKDVIMEKRKIKA